ncbi:MAG: family 10 glycosylhydrolase [Proteiniphilum sp.]|nr:family 10 glycosylhydrolase [Proteiniphilum sp.]
MKNLISERGLIVASLFFLLLFVTCTGGQNENEDASVQLKVRALWVDPPGFADRETVDSLIEKCKVARINTLLPNIMLRENVYFQSENFYGTVNASEEYDPLDYLIEKAHAAGIEVHPWSCVYYSNPQKPEWVSKPLISRNYEHVFLSAAHPEVNPYLLSVLKELLKYDIDGIHLDYTRYWNAGFDYSDTARRLFYESHGFDPQDFLDHPERIAPPESDPYPVRIFSPVTMEERVWELGNIERTMNRIGLGYAMITEQPQNIDRLTAPGMLVVDFYTQFSPDMMKALERFVNRGGDLVWVAPPGSLYTTFPGWKAFSGVNDIRFLKRGLDNLSPVGEGSYAASFTPFQLTTSWNALETGEAEIIATIGSGEPIVARLKKNRGSITTVGFQLMESNNAEMLALFKELILTYRKEAGVTGKEDLLAEKRGEWIDWRASHIHQFVTDVNTMVKSKDTQLQVTAAAGVGPQEYNGIYREGGQWLKDNLCDYIYPMNYSDNVETFREILKEQQRYTTPEMAGRIYPGLQIYLRKDGKTVPLGADIVQEQLEIIKEEGYEGFCLFAYSYFSDEIAGVLKNFE